MTRFNVPYLSAQAIQKKAAQLRQMYLGDDYQLPINVELLAELMGLEIWPVEQLIQLANIDALVVHKLKVIMVDESEYANSISWGRLRFTIAHEIGHYILHLDLFEDVNFASIPEWVTFLRSLDNYDRIEIQAHEFAGSLVVPSDHLKLCIQDEKTKLTDLQGDELEERLAIRISRVFHVSPDLIQVRFDRENLKQFIHS